MPNDGFKVRVDSPWHKHLRKVYRSIELTGSQLPVRELLPIDCKWHSADYQIWLRSLNKVF